MPSKKLAVVVSISEAEEFYNLLRVERNDQGDVRVQWHPDLLFNPEARKALLRELDQAAEQAELTDQGGQNAPGRC